MNPIQSIPEPELPDDCPELNPAPLAGNDPAGGPAGPAPPEVTEPPASRPSRFLEKVYYWVLSRH